MSRIPAVRRVVAMLLTTTSLAAASIAVVPCPAAAVGAVTHQPFGFGLTAKGFPSYFRLSAEPGRDLAATLQVVNRLRRPETVELGSAAVGTASLGGLAFGQAASSVQAGWLHLSRRRVRLPAGGTVGVPFTVDVPRSAAPGQHFLGIVATPAHPQPQHVARTAHIALRVITRLAMTVEVSLPGPRRHRMAVGRAGFLSEPAGAFLTLGLSNQGNTLVGSTTGAVVVRYDGRTLLRAPLHLGPFVPRTAISLHLPWSATLRPGRYVVTGDLHPVGQRGLRFRRVLVIGSRAVATAAAEPGARIVDQASQTPLEIGIGALGGLCAIALLAWSRERRHRSR